MIFQKCVLFNQDRNACGKPAASLKRRKWGLGIPNHIQMQFNNIHMPFIAIEIHQYTLSVLNKYNISIVLPLPLSLLGLNSQAPLCWWGGICRFGEFLDLQEFLLLYIGELLPQGVVIMSS